MSSKKAGDGRRLKIPARAHDAPVNRAAAACMVMRVKSQHLQQSPLQLGFPGRTPLADARLLTQTNDDFVFKLALTQGYVEWNVAWMACWRARALGARARDRLRRPSQVQRCFCVRIRGCSNSPTSACFGMCNRFNLTRLRVRQARRWAKVHYRAVPLLPSLTWSCDEKAVH